MDDDGGRTAADVLTVLGAVVVVVLTLAMIGGALVAIVGAK